MFSKIWKMVLSWWRSSYDQEELGQIMEWEFSKKRPVEKVLQ